jgi:hypothetical protein
MSLPSGQQRALSQIEKTLGDDHSGLGPLFAIFTRLAGQEAMPATERVPDRSWRLRWQWRLPRARMTWQRRMWPTAAGVVGLALVAVTLFTLSLTLPSRPACTGTAVSIAARLQTAAPGSQAVCATQPSGPGKAGPASAGASRAKSAG